MTLTTLITGNVVLGALVAYGLHHLLAHGIRSDRTAHSPQRAISVERVSHDSERIAA